MAELALMCINTACRVTLEAEPGTRQAQLYATLEVSIEMQAAVQHARRRDWNQVAFVTTLPTLVPSGESMDAEQQPTAFSSEEVVAAVLIVELEPAMPRPHLGHGWSAGLSSDATIAIFASSDAVALSARLDEAQRNQIGVRVSTAGFERMEGHSKSGSTSWYVRDERL